MIDGAITSHLKCRSAKRLARCVKCGSRPAATVMRALPPTGPPAGSATVPAMPLSSMPARRALVLPHSVER